MTTTPVTLLTGFLGSGKTTQLNALLKSGALKDAALIINEFGDIGIDHLLVETSDEGIVELSDGCLCCTIRGDLVDTLTRLLNRARDGEPISRIVIETTGLADPAPILHAVMGHPVLSDLLRLDGVITMVDAVNGEATLDAHEEAVKQIAVADRVVLSKHDLAGDTSTIEGRIARLNPTAKLIKAPAQPKYIFDCGLYDPATRSADVQRWLNDEALKHGHHHHHDVNRHDARIRAFTLRSDKAVDAATLATFIDLLRSAHGPNLLRVKGIVRIAEDPERPVVLHGVQEIFHPPASLPNWPDEDRTTRLVMITRDLAPDFVEKLFDALVGNTKADTPDRAALDENPLAVPGYSGNFD
ncbi:CobW family GTP-binding protein [Pseudahrensia aquimaris]|uniref:CobW family GTP-binding protein n=1 Tax=Pseudahrensia aquimaris TaxID=744461 RepID=A0ABW3F920_9HYPH